MTAKIKRLLETRPFRPFVLETVGGTHIHVERAEWFFAPPESEDFVVFSTGGGYWICAYKDLTENIAVR